MLWRLLLAIFLSFLIHFSFFNHPILFQWPRIELAQFPVSMELTIQAQKRTENKQNREITSSILKSDNTLIPPAKEIIKKASLMQRKQTTFPALPAVHAMSQPEALPQRGVRQAVLLEGQKPPAYPLVAQYRHWEGVVVLKVRVLENGRCGKIILKESSGFKLLDQAAIEGIQDWEFKPATQNGIAIESEIEIPIRFQLQAPRG